MNLNPNQVERLCNHLGHSEAVHKEFYRLHDPALELTEIGNMLIEMDRGASFTEERTGKLRHSAHS